MSRRVALVTGGSSGIGEETALRLREADFEVYAVARRVDRMAGAGAGTASRCSRWTSPTTHRWSRGVQRIIDERGRIDVLVNNAGYGSYGAVEDVPIDEARRQFEVNVFGLARLIPAGHAAHARRRAVAAGSSTSPRSAGSSTSRSARGTTPPSSPSRASATACGSSCAPFGIDVVIIEPAADPHRVERDLPREPRRDQRAAVPTRRWPARSRRVMERADTAGCCRAGPEPSPGRS